MTKIITMGSALLDIMTMLEDDKIFDTLKFPKGSMQLVDLEFSEKIQQYTNGLYKTITSGGSAANTARCLACLGTPTAYIGKVGNDELGKLFIEDMHKVGVTTKIIESDSPSGRAVALIEKNSERTFATFLGASSELKPSEISDSIFDGYNILHIEGYLIFNNDLIETAIQKAKENGLSISIDLASFNVVEENLDFLKYLVEKYVDIVFANEEEAKAFTKKEPEEALDELAEICDIAIVKIGKNGSLIKKGDKKYTEGVIQVTPIDSTGAGDYYAGGFLHGLANNWDLAKCARAGAILSGNVIESIGVVIDDEKWKKIHLEIEALNK